MTKKYKYKITDLSKSCDVIFSNIIIELKSLLKKYSNLSKSFGDLFKYDS